MTREQLRVRIETINTLISVFGDDDGMLMKELNEVYEELKRQENNDIK